MGSEIVYCFKCQSRLLASDFDKGSAVRFTDRVACVPCASEYMASLPPDQRDAAVRKPSESSSRAIRPVAPRPVPPSTARIPRPAPEPAPRKNPYLIPGLAGGGLVLAGVVLLVFMGGNSRPPEDVIITSERKTPSTPRTTDAPPPPEDPLIKPAREALDRARAVVAEHPTDFARQKAAFEEAVRKADRTPLFREASLGLDAVAEKIRKGPLEDLAKLEAQLAPLLTQQDFKGALALVEGQRKKHDLPEWAGKIEAKAKEILESARALLPPLREQAAEARRKGKAEDEKTLRDGIEKWGLPELLKEFDAHLAGVARPDAAMTAFLPRWKEALFRAVAQDFEAAAAELRRAAKELKEEALRKQIEADADAIARLPALRAAALQGFPEWAKGKKLALEVAEGTGEVRKLNGAVTRADASRGSVGGDAVEWADLTAAALAEIDRQRKGASADLKSWALGCLLEGDVEAAQRLSGDDAQGIPARFWEFAPEAAPKRPRPSARELEARKLFAEAERDARKVETLDAAVAKAKTLLADFADTRLVRGDGAALLRLQGLGREYFIGAIEMRGSGSFRRSKQPVGTMWASTADSESSENNWVELKFAAMPETAYKLWIYAGACCTETFTFDLQASDLAVPDPKKRGEQIKVEPGGSAALPVKPSVRNVRATHAAHGGPKEAKTWDWIPVALPKYPAPGLKRVRILTNHKGFSILCASVSSSRTAPPPAAELKEEMAKNRPAPEVVTDGIVGWWKLDLVEGTTVPSALEGGVAGTVRGTISFGEAGATFDGKGAFIEIPADGPLETVSEKSFTITAWFTPSEVPPEKGEDPNAAYGILIRQGLHQGLYYNWEQKFVLDHWIVGNQNRSAGSWNETFAAAKTYHVAGLVDITKGVTRLFVNGVPKGERTFEANTQGRPYGKTAWRIGIGNPDSSAKWSWPARGTVRDVRIYNRALSDAELQELSDAGREK